MLPLYAWEEPQNCFPSFIQNTNFEKVQDCTASLISPYDTYNDITGKKSDLTDVLIHISW